ncbi:MAG: GFA family protein [Pseudomonadota bacterium]
MTSAKSERRLAAILVGDVVGYSRMMGADQEGTLEALQSHRFALLDPTIGQYHGRVVKRMGDGVLVEFQSVLDAVNCAMALQRGTVNRNAGVAEDRQLRWRIGINLGDVIIQDGDVFGDGVNIAARLQEIAEPNGVAIASTVFAHVEAELGGEFADLGAHEFKNIARPLRVYHYSPEPAAAPARQAFRPFIDIPSPEAPLITGGCLCGAVRFEVKGKTLGSMLCQCRMCQRFSGAPILGGTTFLTEDVKFVKGEPKYYRSSAIAERGFCAICSSPLTYRGTLGTWSQWIMVWTASLDEPEKFPPTYHLGIESAMPWLPLHDDLPRTACRDSPSLVDAYGTVGEEVP